MKFTLVETKSGYKTHVGYYLIGEGIQELLNKLQYNKKCNINKKTKVNLYIYGIWGTAIILDIIFINLLSQSIKNLILLIVAGLLLLIPIQEIVNKIVQYILGKIVKPKLIPKLDFQNGIDKENATFVVIPTILKNKEKVKELIKKLEVYYLANKSENLYFALLGDCSSGQNKEEKFDEEVIKEGLKQIELLNEKYKTQEGLPKFNFIYRKRFWNGKEECYLGWERKRGLLNQFNEYILGNEENVFKANTIEDWKKKNKEIDLPKIKYIITLDADTELPLNTGLELIGAMAHILNKPILNENKDVVIKGHALIQPRVGVNLEAARKNLFTKIFAGAGGTDSYANAISDIYEDNFGEGIFTGKGIYDLEVFSKVLKNEIPENTVLSHDLLEGSYLRAGLATDIMLMDGYPSNYNSYKSREHRWIRGDFQIIRWLGKYIIDKKENKKINPLNKLSKYKIFDNLIRSILPISIIFSFIYLIILNKVYSTPIISSLIVLFLAISMPLIIDIIDKIVYRKEGKKIQKSFEPSINIFVASVIRTIISIATIPDKAYSNLNAITKTLYRLFVSKKHMLEWVTSEDAEKMSKTDLKSYYKNMCANVIIGIFGIIISYTILTGIVSIILLMLSILWLIAPILMWYISKEIKQKNAIDQISEEDKIYLYEIGKKTWQYFKDLLNEDNNYLIPDNYQEDRKPKYVSRTSPTNIGLSILAVISSYDLAYEKLEDTFKLLDKIITTIENLPKWQGHLYNWYNTKTLEPLIPRYISTVDSGNFIGYIYVLKQFYNEIKEKIEKGEIDKELIKYIPEWVDKPISEIPFAKADFSKLYDYEKELFTIGFNVEENKLTDSYYDLLASEARQASLIAIAKKDIKSKHWHNLSRTLTNLNGYKGLISWSGTAFEYLMPNINIKKYKGSLLDESCRFMIMSQKEYAKKLGVPWGFSETAFNVKDLNNNYQYKAIGIPWLGLKRGLEDDIVVSTYGSVLAITEDPKSVIKNLKILEKQGMVNKYGFYESIDYTPNRLSKGKKYEPIKTYMAHHQGLILVSINNLFGNNIIQKRFADNPEIEAIDILLQERIPEKIIVTKEEKVKPSKIKYVDYENYCERKYTKVNQSLQPTNVIATNEYTIVMNAKGEGYSKYKNIYINRFKETSDEAQGIFFYLKNIKTKRIWTANYMNYLSKPDKYEIKFAEDMNQISRIDGNIETKQKVTIDGEEPIEIRNISLTNNGLEAETIEVTSFIEPILSNNIQDYMHPAFNNLFLVCEYLEDINMILLTRRTRTREENKIYMAISFDSDKNSIGELEYETDKEKFTGRGNLLLPIGVENSKPFTKKANLSTDPIVALKRTITINPEEQINLNYIMALADSKEQAIERIKKYKSNDSVKRAFELSRARVDTENRYLAISAKNIETYQKMLSYVIYKNGLGPKYDEKMYPISELWKYGISGDLPIIVLKMKNGNDEYVLREVLNAYEYFRIKNIYIDLVIINEEPNSYENYLKQVINNEILSKGLEYLKNIKGGIFVLENIEDLSNIEFRARLVLSSNLGPISRQIKDIEEEYFENEKKVADRNEKIIGNIEEKIYEDKLDIQNLKYYNEYGGFSSDGKEYLIKVNKEKRLPTVWSNIMANEKFGTLVTESMGGYTWSKNSRLNRLTSWSNNQVIDIPSEIIYMQDEETGKAWSAGLNPMPDNNDYFITYGFGYSKYKHTSNGILQNLDVFVPKSDSVKINILNLKNLEARKRKMRLFYYIKPVLGEDETITNGAINIKYDRNSNIIYAKNLQNTEFNEIFYVSSSEKIKSYTGNKKSFVGNYNLSNPEALKKVSLSNEFDNRQNNIIAIEIEVELEAFEEKDISLIIGTEEKLLECKNTSYKYSKISNCITEYQDVKKSWQERIQKLQVKTPVESFNIILNGWAVYQSIVSRLWGRTGFYQSGGAFGFRDQLQDCIGVKHVNINFMKNQIIKHSSHQFIEGDVEHWWHDETSRGIRTRFSDDLLWLVYMVYEYIEFTGDYSILEIEVPYRKGEILEEGIDEKYDLYEESDVKESIFMHCIRAIEKSLNFGENGLPKIGSGDWNDGMNTVGNKGKGESVWLGFFLYDILNKFTKICEQIKEMQTKVAQLKLTSGTNEAQPNFTFEENNNLLMLTLENQIEKYKNILEKLKKALNTNGWDGRWYRRAFTDEGQILGTIQNEECKIDGISQSWSVISDAGDNDKKYISMESLENHLVDRENGIIKLLDPPFEKSKLEPGYIKAYIPGTRENGGQYTHGAIWAIIAMAKLGFGDKAVELFRMINPIEHSKTKEAALKYKVEPYVIPADIYGYGNLLGRGGWTWYTGSSSWMQEAGITWILGLKIRNKVMTIEPCIASSWKEYEIHYKYGESIYNIKVFNPNGKNMGVEKVVLNGQLVENKKIMLNEISGIYNVEVYM